MDGYPLATPGALSDSLIGQVRLRAPAGRRNAEIVTPFRAYTATYEAATTKEIPHRNKFRATGDTTHTLLSLTVDAADKPMQFPIALMQTSVSSPEPLKKTNTLKRIDANKSRRREQCRANQARYRDRQRNAQRQLEKCVEQLHNDLATLKHRSRDLSSRERSNHSPWTIVAEVFRLIEASFRMPWGLDLDRESHQIEAILERAFAHDAAMGELRNVDALMEQLRLFSQYFGDPELQLQRIENVAPGVMAARAKLSVTVTKLTLCHVFSRLETTTGTVDTYEYLRQQLLGQRLHCNSSMNFFLTKKTSVLCAWKLRSI